MTSVNSMTASGDIYIPPPGLQFRIWGQSSEQVIFSRTMEPEVGLFSLSPVFPDHWFTLIHGTGEDTGLYAIKSMNTGKVLFCRQPVPHVGHIAGDGQFKDNWFEIERGSGQLSKYFRLITPSEDVALVSRTHLEPYLDSYTSSNIFPDQHFAFLYEDMQVDSVDYDVGLGRITQSTPIVLSSQTVKNDSNLEQQTTVTVNETTTHTSSFEYSLGFNLTVDTTFKASIPFVAEGQIGITAELSNQWTWGKVDSTSFSYTAEIPVKVQAAESVKVSAIVSSGTLTVPFTIYLSSISTGVKVETKGVWRGATTWDLTSHYEVISN